MLRKTGLLLVALAIATNAFARPIDLTLEDAVLLAIRNNPNLKQDELDRISQKFALVLANNEFEPQYALTANASYTNSVTSTLNTPTTPPTPPTPTPIGPAATGQVTTTRTFAFDTNIQPEVKLKTHAGTELSLESDNSGSNGIYSPTLTFSVMQPLLQGFGQPVVDAALNNARDDELVNKLKFKQSAITTVSTTIGDYLTLVQDYETLRSDEESLKQFEQIVENDKILIKAGRMARSDIVQAKASVVNQKATIQNDQNAIYASKNTLLADLGLPPRVQITIPQKLDFQKIKRQLTGGSKIPDIKQSEDIALANQIDYQTALITIRTLRRSLLLALDKRRWTLDLTATEKLGPTTNSSFHDLFSGRNHEESVSLDLTVPIDDVANQADVIDQQVALENSLIALKETRRDLLDSTNTAYRTVLSSEKSLEISQRALQLQKQTVYISQQKHLAGKASTFEVVTNQKDLTTQQVEVVDNQINYLKSIVAYEDQLGITLEPWHIDLKY